MIWPSDLTEPACSGRKIPYFWQVMKSLFLKSVSFLGLFLLSAATAFSQCSVCSKTAMQLGRNSAEGLNQGIVYLMGIPFVLAAVVGYKFWKKSQHGAEE